MFFLTLLVVICIQNMCTYSATRDLSFLDTSEINNLQQSEPLLISLGYNCHCALQIQKHGWRVASFPFDWNLSTIKGINCLFQNDFHHFLDIEYLRSAQAPHYGCVYNTLYEILFSHDFHTPDWENALDQVKIKYERRIKRFNDLSKYTGKIYFIRLIFNVEDVNAPLVHELNVPHRLNTDEIIDLKAELIKKFPLVDFELILIFYGDKSNYDWSALQIKDFYIHGKNDQWWQDWSASYIEEQFCDIFESLGIPKKSGGDFNFNFNI